MTEKCSGFIKWQKKLLVGYNPHVLLIKVKGLLESINHGQIERIGVHQIGKKHPGRQAQHLCDLHIAVYRDKIFEHHRDHLKGQRFIFEHALMRLNVAECALIAGNKTSNDAFVGAILRILRLLDNLLQGARAIDVTALCVFASCAKQDFLGWCVLNVINAIARLIKNAKLKEIIPQRLMVAQIAASDLIEAFENNRTSVIACNVEQPVGGWSHRVNRHKLYKLEPHPLIVRFLRKPCQEKACNT